MTTLREVDAMRRHSTTKGVVKAIEHVAVEQWVRSGILA